MHKIRQALLLGMGALCLLSVPTNSVAETFSAVQQSVQLSSPMTVTNHTSASSKVPTTSKDVTKTADSKPAVLAGSSSRQKVIDDTMRLPHTWRAEVQAAKARTTSHGEAHRHTVAAASDGPSVYIPGLRPSLIPVYKAAGRRFGIPWSVLAAIHKTETDFAVSHCPVSSEGAQGPMQFMPTTFARYGVAAPGHGRPNIQNVNDAIYTAANMLARDGCARDPAGAVYNYNHSRAYVNRVLTLAHLPQ